MIKRLMHYWTARFEREFAYDASYMHELIDLDARGFWHFSRIAYAGEYRAGLPVGAILAAKLAATLHEDCGPCAQLVVNFAAKAGMPPASVAALVRNDPARAGPDAGLAFRFAQAVLTNAPELTALRAEVVARFGRCGPALLGFAIAVARMFPVLKRAMGHAHTCVRLQVAGTPIQRPT
jgi:hypothetical protein